MKAKYLIVLLSCLLSFSCSKKCILNYEIVGTEYEVPFYRTQNEMIREHYKVNSDRYGLVNINESEIPYIMEIVHSQISKNERATERMIDNLCDYSVQIAGIYDRDQKTKKIYLNFKYGHVGFEENNASNEIRIDVDKDMARFNHVYDGGDSRFQAIINTKTNKFGIIFINGEA